MVLLLNACASLPKGRMGACEQKRVRPSYFAQGEKLAAFRANIHIQDQALAGILQIKKTGEEQYDITVFSEVAGYRLLQATLGREGIKYNFIAPAINYTVVQTRIERSLNLLLLPSLSEGTCKIRQNDVRINYKQPAQKYIYLGGAVYPSELVGAKTFGKLHLYFADYRPYEEGELPYYLHYRDGAVELDLTLLRLKK